MVKYSGSRPLIHTGFCAGSKDRSEYGSYGHTNKGGGEVSPLL